MDSETFGSDGPIGTQTFKEEWKSWQNFFCQKKTSF